MTLYGIKRSDGTIVQAPSSGDKDVAWHSAACVEGKTPSSGNELMLADTFMARYWRITMSFAEGSIAKSAAREIGILMGYTCVEVESAEKKP